MAYTHAGPVDCVAVPVFGPLGDVVAVLECLNECSIEEDLEDYGKVIGLEEELTLWCMCCVLGLGMSMCSKSVLNAKLAVDDTVRRLYAETSRATSVSSSWRAVAEAACFLSGVGEEDDVCLCADMVGAGCKATYGRV